MSIKVFILKHCSYLFFISDVVWRFMTVSVNLVNVPSLTLGERLMLDESLMSIFCKNFNKINTIIVFHRVTSIIISTISGWAAPVDTPLSVHLSHPLWLHCCYWTKNHLSLQPYVCYWSLQLLSHLRHFGWAEGAFSVSCSSVPNYPDLTLSGINCSLLHVVSSSHCQQTGQWLTRRYWITRHVVVTYLIQNQTDHRRGKWRISCLSF